MLKQTGVLCMSWHLSLHYFISWVSFITVYLCSHCWPLHPSLCAHNSDFTLSILPALHVLSLLNVETFLELKPRTIFILLSSEKTHQDFVCKCVPWKCCTEKLYGTPFVIPACVSLWQQCFITKKAWKVCLFGWWIWMKVVASLALMANYRMIKSFLNYTQVGFDIFG